MRGDLKIRWVRLPILASIALAASVAHSQSFTVGVTTHSLQSDNAGIGSGIDMQMESSADFYINGFNVVGGGSWDPNLSVNFNGGYFDNNSFTYGTYSLGTQVTGTQDWYFGGFFGGMFTLGFADTVGLGTYTTTIELLGGATESSMDVLTSFDETVEVVDFGLALSSPDTNVILPPLGSTNIRHHVVNSSNHDFLVGSRYYGWSMPGRDQFDIDFSDGYPAKIDAGADVLLTHLDITAHADFTTPFTFASGFIGGWYADDAVWLKVSDHTLTPVPEPMTVIGLAGALAALASRRRRANR